MSSEIPNETAGGGGLTLTKRLREVLALRQKGLNGAQIATELNIALGTVKTHIKMLILVGATKPTPRVLRSQTREGMMREQRNRFVTLYTRQLHKHHDAPGEMLFDDSELVRLELEKMEYED